MTPERLAYEVDQWHKAQGPARKPDYWPAQATVCEIPQSHELKTETLKIKGHGISLAVHYCTKCAFSLTLPEVEEKKGGKSDGERSSLGAGSGSGGNEAQ